MEDSHFSVLLRLRRVTVEYAFVHVPVTDDLTVTHPDGTRRIDTEKLVAHGCELGEAPELLWRREEQRIEPHPLQTPEPPE